MAKRPKLRMTNADYVAIAVSPALIMALVGSLVFFLIEVLYVGQYQARLMYVFALFVFAAVLIGRISIEMGSERAALFALPLGVAMFLVLAKFVEHASPYSHLINVALLGLVWWSAHKLTWDCTLIDDNEDASGEGLMQRIGVDEAESNEDDVLGKAENELLGTVDPTSSGQEREAIKKNTPHTPGVWVLYFSLAALPLFGLGQKWIPATDMGRRQYAFGLLAVYVAAGLTLLVTTSFLGLRRYLRQRRVEMPTPMAATWVVTGAALIGIVMLLAALIPRPQAEYAISQVPWQVRLPMDLASAKNSFGHEGTEDEEASEGSRTVLNDESDPNASAKREGDDPTTTSEEGETQTDSNGGEESESGKDNQGKSSESDEEGEPDTESGTKSERQSERQDPSDAKRDTTDSSTKNDSPREESTEEQPSNASNAEANDTSSSKGRKPTTPTESPSPPPSLPDLVPTLGGLMGILKLALYFVLGLVALYLAWRNREQIAQAIADIVRQIREFLAALFGGKAAIPADELDGETEKTNPNQPRPFASFADPFASGKHRAMPPDELVRHTFEAFEAWAREQGYPRSPDQTPLELVRRAITHESPMQPEALRLVRLYNEAAYAPGTVSKPAVEKLARLWSFMRQPVQTPLESVS